jgi:hypothetical protein
MANLVIKSNVAINLCNSCGGLQFEAGSFDVVMDKGGLDALMGEDTSDADMAGTRLLAEVARVLDPAAGTYICVSLLQPHVLSRPYALLPDHNDVSRARDVTRKEMLASVFFILQSEVEF